MPWNIQIVVIAAIVVVLGVMFFMVAGRISTDRKRSAQDEATAKQRRLDLESKIETLMNSQTTMAEKMDTLAKAAETTQTTVLEKMETRVKEVTGDVEKRLSTHADKTAKALDDLGDKLEKIDAAETAMSGLSAEVTDLNATLSDKRAFGAIAEIQLADIVRGALPPAAYAFQTTLSNNRKADCIVKLPTPPGPMVIDAKFPVAAYEALRAAETEDEKSRTGTEFRKAVLKHIVDIAERFIVPGETADSAIMFVPSEAAYAELHGHYADVVQDSFRARVWIAAPTTLMATLTTIRAVLKDTLQRERADAMGAEAARVAADVKDMRRQMEAIQRQFLATQKAINQLIAAGDSVAARAAAIEKHKKDADGEAESLQATTDLFGDEANVKNSVPKQSALIERTVTARTDAEEEV